MKQTFKLILKLKIALICIALISSNIYGQCENWNNLPNKDEIETAHVLYRTAVKAEDFGGAYENWKIAYDAAPAADGKRAFHYQDGRKIYKSMWEKETDEAKKKEYMDFILKLYGQQIECFGKEAFLYGRQAYDMYYTYNLPAVDVYNISKKSVDKGGNKSEYVVLVPYAASLVTAFKEGKVNKEDARAAHKTLYAIADHNIANNEKYGSYYQQSKDAMDGQFAAIQYDIFDCAYFKNKLKPEYEANPNDPENLKTIIGTLKRQGCDSSDPFLSELEAKWSTYAASENARRQTEFNANNPAFKANNEYKNGNFPGAIDWYKKAIEVEGDPSKQASYYYSIASIQFRKMKQYSTARTNARKAAELRSGWGKPYMLIGDMYATTSSSCGGDAWSKQLAILAAMEKWGYAKSIDAEVGGDATKKIGKYLSYRPDKGEAHMRNKHDGDKVKVPCWIGETVTLKVQ